MQIESETGWTQSAIRQADLNASSLAEYAWTEQHQVDRSYVTELSNPTNHTARLAQGGVAY